MIYLHKSVQRLTFGKFHFFKDTSVCSHIDHENTFISHTRSFHVSLQTSTERKLNTTLMVPPPA